jgi:hypothetical protein
MKTHGCYQLVFSSSCTVYGNPDILPITEEHHTGNVTNVYGRTKYFIEEMLKDISAAEKVNIMSSVPIHMATQLCAHSKCNIIFFMPFSCGPFCIMFSIHWYQFYTNKKLDGILHPLHRLGLIEAFHLIGLIRAHSRDNVEVVN